MPKDIKREKVVVVCPGRGTYTKSELGYLKKYRPAIDPYVHAIDEYLRKQGAPTVSELDNAAQFSPALHTPGENASTLIYACSLADFLAIDQDRFEVVAVTGNSLGWYTALAVGGALQHDHAIHLISTMGSMMKGGVVGGQIVYPLVDEAWRMDPKKMAAVEAALTSMREQNIGRAYHSIRFGGYAVIGGDPVAVRYLMSNLPKIEDRYPMQLVNHAAFHTPLLEDVAVKARTVLGEDLFSKPKYPLIDGRGFIWQPYATRVADLYQYTLGHQVCRTYDFWMALSVALKEFAPDRLILLGPGSTSGGAIGQVLVNEGWLGMRSKEDFSNGQQKHPFLISMGLSDQRALVSKN